MTATEQAAARAAGAVTPPAPSTRPVRVLLSLAPPDGTTRFVDQITTGLPPDVEPVYFTWRAALTGRYDVFHVHWPDALMRGTGRLRLLAPVLYALLLLRLSVLRTPVVRTLHNVAPHERATPVETWLLHRTDALTTAFVRLNTSTTFPRADGVLTATIVHGHYRDRFAAHPRAPMRENTLLFFGLIRPYKGVDTLLDSVAGLGEDWRLRIVGAPKDDALARRVTDVCATDPRVSADLRFVPDADLVGEISGAEVVVLPYAELHNSGALLVALSLDRPVIVPDTPTTAALAAEVGDAWVIRLPGPLTPTGLADAVSTVRRHRAARRTRPVLDERDWSSVATRHAELYRRAAGRFVG